MQIKSIILSLLFLAFSTAAHSSEKVKLAEAGYATVKTVVDNEGAYLSVKLPGGAEQRLPAEDYFGKDFYTFDFNGKEVELATFDADGDDRQEILVHVMATPMMSAVYVYRWNTNEKNFVAIPFDKKDFLAAGTGDFKVSSKEAGGVSISYDVQPIADFGKPPKKSYLWQWHGNSFRKLKP